MPDDYDDRDDRGYDDKTYTDDVSRLGLRRASPLPWVLFAITAVMATVVSVVLAGRASDAAVATAKEVEKRVSSETRAKSADDRLGASQARVTELEALTQKLSEERDGLAAKLKAAEVNKVAQAKADAAAKAKADAAAKAAAKKAAAKKAAAKKKKRK
jgi:hypothetical protein